MTYKMNFWPTDSLLTALHPIFILRSWSLFWQHSKASLLLKSESKIQVGTQRLGYFIIEKNHKSVDIRDMFSWWDGHDLHKIGYWSLNSKYDRRYFDESYFLQQGSILATHSQERSPRKFERSISNWAQDLRI